MLFNISSAVLCLFVYIIIYISEAGGFVKALYLMVLDLSCGCFCHDCQD